MTKEIRYDIAISFAGEDREYAEALAEALRRRGVTVFYDKYEQATLWGKNLYTHLSDLYQNQARYCVMFLSEHYARKAWTNHEREAAQARAFQEHEEYILPVRLDNTIIPGIPLTIAYLSWPPENAETVSDAIVAKLNPQQDPSGEPAATLLGKRSNAANVIAELRMRWKWGMLAVGLGLLAVGALWLLRETGIPVPSTASGSFGYPLDGATDFVRGVIFTRDGPTRVSITTDKTIYLGPAQLGSTVIADANGISLPRHRLIGSYEAAYTPLEEKEVDAQTALPISKGSSMVSNVGALIGAFIPESLSSRPGFQPRDEDFGTPAISSRDLFFIGKGPFLYTAPEPGILYFGINEPFVSNNSGEFRVKGTPVLDTSSGFPGYIPWIFFGTAIVIISGLIGLLVRRKQKKTA